MQKTEQSNTGIEQLSFMPNGNIAPCPYREECITYGSGCRGESYWCKRYDKPKKVVMFGKEWTPITEKPEGITRYDRLEISGTYKTEKGEQWSCCQAYYDGKQVIALDVPWDIPKPDWKYWRLREKVYPVDIRGICDDAYCPECNTELDDLRFKDCEKCPWCGVRIDWTPWHRANDEEG